ncbi:ABC transporter ATP-binding protein [Micromonospora sp. KC213]|uniref:ABC transporter ATP-binding protein n=1 Tax=Micromonospora sp. KC213 TaxID=2530378 RepID=UPI001044F12C|nr:ABC transporter ATP-binding protein [Micromonospora sp. KC213]TDC40762.1 ABC transporter ATP-binding protein [Micromonospora sp. KC213]
MTASDCVLRTDGLGKRYRRTWALRDCTLALPTGRVIALVGPNGAGKSTLLRLTVGLLAPTTGTVEVLGESPTTNTPQVLSRVGFLAQDHPLYRHFTVADLLRFGRSCNLRFDQGLAERRLSQLGIPLDRKAGALSGGQQSQVALALALAKRPDLLVLDEPMASLDPVARLEFLQVLMGAVAADGITVLFSSHVVPELERVCDHLVLLNHSRVTLAGDIETLLTEHRLLVGPRTTTDLDRAGTVVEATHSDRQTTLLVRDGGAPTAPHWQAHPIGLEDLVLAYLRRPAPHGAALPVDVAEVPA